MIKKAILFCLDFLFPRQCLICQKENSYLCRKCLQSLKAKENHYYQVGELYGLMSVGRLSNSELDKIIKIYKYDFVKELSEPLGKLLSDFLLDNFFTNPIIKSPQQKNIADYLFLPVPLSKKRLKWRGFNQSEELIKSMQKNIPIKASQKLIKIKDSPTQADLNKKERLNNLQNCFKWTGEKIKNKKIIIVDDIYTTGATLNEISRELKKHQVKEIWGLTIAKG